LQSRACAPVGLQGLATQAQIIERCKEARSRIIDRDGLRLYTDYLSLVRFPDGWKIVAKVYMDHSAV